MLMKKGKVYIKPHRWKRGKNKRHPGYYRKKRPKGKKKIISKKPVKLYPIRDEYGRILGYSNKPKR